MRKTVFVAAALFAASSAFAEAPTPKGNTASPESPQVKQIAGGQSGGASAVVAGGVAQTRLSPLAWVGLGVAVLIIAASAQSPSPTPGPSSH